MMHPKLIGTHPTIRQIRHTLRGFANCDAHLLILGEPGVGRTFVGRLLHAYGPYGGTVLRSLNFALLSEHDQRVMLFGTEPPESSSERQGAIELTTTCLLRNMERALPHIQDRLIEAVTRGEFQRTPHGPLRRVSSRIIVTLHLDEFRRGTGSNLTTSMRDFLRRLPKLVLPPLRERPQDIPLLAAHYRKRVLGMSKPALPLDDSLLSPEFLKNHPWRENVTELKACLRGARLLSHVDLLQRPGRLEYEKMMMKIEECEDFSMGNSIAAIEAEILGKVLRIRKQKTHAAHMVGISVPNLIARQKLMQL